MDVVVVALLLAPVGSLVCPSMVAVFWIVLPEATVGAATFTLAVRVAPTGSAPMVQVMVPPAPMAGVAQAQPAGAASEANVVPAGSGSVSVTLMATSGPRFWAVRV
jgi:hypothetical protein